jgi:hypothetical protein
MLQRICMLHIQFNLIGIKKCEMKLKGENVAKRSKVTINVPIVYIMILMGATSITVAIGRGGP